MSSKFSRFLHLERSRGERPKPEEPVRLQSGNRFETLAERGEAPQEAAVPEAHLERFRGEAPLALAEAQSQSEEQRFPRCARCESDNGRFAKECTVCGADLNTPQQLAYNERLWRTRQQELAREREATAALAHQQSGAEKQAEAARYAYMLEKLREEERSSVQWHFFFGEGPLGLKLLALIPNPVVRWGILLGSILLPLALWRYGRGQVRSAAMIIGFIVFVLLFPSNSGRRNRWR